MNCKYTQSQTFMGIIWSFLEMIHFFKKLIVKYNI